MVPLDSTEDDVTWVASRLYGAADALVVEAIELHNWLFRFGCLSEELRVVVTRLADCMANSTLSWDTDRALMERRLVALDKRPGVRPVGIGETIRWDLDKLIMRAAGDQAKTACGNIQLCTGLKAIIEGATHAVFQKRLERARARQSEEEEGSLE